MNSINFFSSRVYLLRKVCRALDIPDKEEWSSCSCMALLDPCAFIHASKSPSNSLPNFLIFLQTDNAVTFLESPDPRWSLRLMTSAATLNQGFCNSGLLRLLRMAGILRVGSPQIACIPVNTALPLQSTKYPHMLVCFVGAACADVLEFQNEVALHRHTKSARARMTTLQSIRGIPKSVFK